MLLISDSKYFWTNILYPKFCWTKLFFNQLYFFNQRCFGPRIFLHPNLFGLLFYGLKIFLDSKFLWTPKFFWNQNYFMTQNFVGPLFFGHTTFRTKEVTSFGYQILTQKSKCTWELSLTLALAQRVFSFFKFVSLSKKTLFLKVLIINHIEFLLHLLYFIEKYKLEFIDLKFHLL